MFHAKQVTTAKGAKIKASVRKATSATLAALHLLLVTPMTITRITQMDPVLSGTTVSKEPLIQKYVQMGGSERQWAQLRTLTVRYVLQATTASKGIQWVFAVPKACTVLLRLLLSQLSVLLIHTTNSSSKIKKKTVSLVRTSVLIFVTVVASPKRALINVLLAISVFVAKSSPLLSSVSEVLIKPTEEPLIHAKIVPLAHTAWRDK